MSSDLNPAREGACGYPAQDTYWGTNQVKYVTAVIQQTSALGFNGVGIDSLQDCEGLQLLRYELLVLNKEEE